MTRARVLIEAAVESVDDAVAAADGGAGRLELCAALDLGGLTPSLGAYLEVRAAVRLPVCVMIRPRGGDFVYSDAEVRVMARDVALFLPHKPDAFVFGALRPDGRVDEEACARLREAAGFVPCVFHRAFDRAPNPLTTLDAVHKLGFVRVLTSGRESDVLAGAEVIAALVKHSAGRVQVLPCGKVRAANVADVVRVTGCDQVHGSFAEPVPVGAGTGYRGYPQRSQTSRAEVAAVRQVLDALPGEPAA